MNVRAACAAVLLPSCSAAAIVPAYFGDANQWHATSAELCLLPFPMADGLLPGESLQIHLSEPHQRNLHKVAMRRDKGCVGQLLERGTSMSADVKSFCAVAPLLELREQEHAEQGGVWCSFTCVGGTHLGGVELRTVSEQNELEGLPARDTDADDIGGESFLVASARLLREEQEGVDYDSADDEEAYLALEVGRVHESVNALRRQALALNRDAPRYGGERITSGGDRIGPPPPASDRVRFGYRLGPLIGPYVSLDELTRLRLDALCVRGVDEAPPQPGAPNRMLDLWGAADGETLRRRMLSFVAVEALHENYRMGALATEDTVSRLRYALAGLQAREAALAAEVALRRASENS